ncbi:hypothetical protein ZWY2020_017488 [Hordeum vulgare]|nr:hypothetical protein ZWY2020_017488 [Hordeum vulgare]
MPPWWLLLHFMVALLAVDVEGRHDRYERTSGDFMGCLKDQIVPRPGQSLDYLVMYWLITIRTVDSEILSCAFGAHNFSSSEHLGPLHVAIVYSPLMLKFVVGVCSFSSGAVCWFPSAAAPDGTSLQPN